MKKGLPVAALFSCVVSRREYLATSQLSTTVKTVASAAAKRKE